MLVEDKTTPGSVVIFKARNSLSLFAKPTVTYKYWKYHMRRCTRLNTRATSFLVYIYDQSVDSSRFALWELISTAQIKRRSWRTRVLKLLLELWALLYIALFVCAFSLSLHFWIFTYGLSQVTWDVKFCFSWNIFIFVLFGSTTTNFGPLSRGQPDVSIWASPGAF